MRFYYINESELLVRRNFKGILLFFVALIYLFIFSSLWLTAYLITTEVLHVANINLRQPVVLCLISCVIYFVLFWLKGIMLYFKATGRKRWIAIYLFCITYTCAIPCLGVYSMFHKHLSAFPLIGLLLITMYVVIGHYQFLTDNASRFGTLAYKFGVDTAHLFLKKK